MKYKSLLLAIAVGVAFGLTLPVDAMAVTVGSSCPADSEDDIPETSNDCNFSGDVVALSKIHGHDPTYCAGSPEKCELEFTIDASWDQGCVKESRFEVNGSEVGDPKFYSNDASGVTGETSIKIACGYNGGAMTNVEMKFYTGHPSPLTHAGSLHAKIQCKECE